LKVAGSIPAVPTNEGNPTALITHGGV